MTIRILLLNRHQFGYLTDSLAYCRYLSPGNDISCFGFDYGLPAIEMDGIEVHHVSRAGGRLTRNLRFVREARALLRSGGFDLCLVTCFPLAFAVRPRLHGLTYVLNVRTGSVRRNGFVRVFFDMLTRLNSLFFGRRMVVSASLRDRLGLGSGARVVPVGAERLSDEPRRFDGIRLLYVGTLAGRNVEMTLEGLRRYLDSREGGPQVSYSIVGDGFPGQVDRLREMASTLGLAGMVEVAGPVPHDRLKPWFDSCNVGVSFVPVTSWYDVQPPTKTFEYLLSGMPVIATATGENRRVITEDLGVLIEDSPEGFAGGLGEIASRLGGFDGGVIAGRSERYHWENVVGGLREWLESFVPQGGTGP